jgi:S1-C subfamily serine protease
VPPVAGPGQAAGIDATRLAAAVGPAVVNVTTRMDPLEGGGRAAGTGMIISRNGQIVTNNHVVQGADTVAVTIRGHGTHPAAVIGTDPSADIAVLKVSGLSGLPAVRFGDSARIAVGDQVLAIGNALGLGGRPTVSQGIISATGRAITATDQTGSNPERLRGLLQTDAPIAPGNSGGPLVDAAGAVIGMDTAAASAGTGGASLGFAIPANTIRVIAGEITRAQEVAWPGLRPPAVPRRRDRQQLAGRERGRPIRRVRQSVRAGASRDHPQRHPRGRRRRRRPGQSGGPGRDHQRRCDHRD